MLVVSQHEVGICVDVGVVWLERWDECSLAGGAECHIPCVDIELNTNLTKSLTITLNKPLL